MSLIRREPSLLRGFDPFSLQSFFDPMWSGGRQLTRAEDGPIAPLVDIAEKENAYPVSADLPGLTKDDIDVSIEAGMLTIKAEIQKESKQEEGEVIRHERFNQQYLRRLDLGPQASMDGIEAEFNNGVLTIMVPKVENVPEKSIRIPVL